MEPEGPKPTTTPTPTPNTNTQHTHNNNNNNNNNNNTQQQHTNNTQQQHNNNIQQQQNNKQTTQNNTNTNHNTTQHKNGLATLGLAKVGLNLPHEPPAPWMCARSSGSAGAAQLCMRLGSAAGLCDYFRPSAQPISVAKITSIHDPPTTRSSDQSRRQHQRPRPPTTRSSDQSRQ